MSSRTPVLVRFMLALAAPFTLAALLLPACVDNLEDGRFPICKTNEDCSARDGGAETGICWNLRCVACRYDTDCAAGAYCGSDNSCKSLVSKAAEEKDPTDWDPKTIDECLQKCEDKECIDTCGARFPDTKKRRSR